MRTINGIPHTKSSIVVITILICPNTFPNIFLPSHFYDFLEI